MWLAVVQFGQFWDHWQWDQYVPLVHELALWSTFPVEEQLVQSRLRGEDLGFASNDVSNFVDYLWEALASMKRGCGGKKVGGVREEECDRKLEFVYKIKKIIFKNKQTKEKEKN